MFPAGEVSHLNWAEHTVAEPCWNTAAVTLARRAQAPLIPAFFEGVNSLPFQLAGTLHPGLRTMGLVREFAKMRGKNVRVRIGSPISREVLSAYRTAEAATEYVRSRTLFLSNRPWRVTPHSPAGTPQTRLPPAPGRRTEQLLGTEIAALPAPAELLASDEYSVFVARSG
jgi:putative hemolysin